MLKRATLRVAVIFGFMLWVVSLFGMGGALMSLGRSANAGPSMAAWSVVFVLVTGILIKMGVTFRNYCDLLEIDATDLLQIIPRTTTPFGPAAPQALTQSCGYDKTWGASNVGSDYPPRPGKQGSKPTYFLAGERLDGQRSVLAAHGS